MREKKCTSIIHKFKRVVLYLSGPSLCLRVGLLYPKQHPKQHPETQHPRSSSTLSATHTFAEHPKQHGAQVAPSTATALAEQGPFRQHHPRSCLMTLEEKLVISFLFHGRLTAFTSDNPAHGKQAGAVGIFLNCVQCSGVASASPLAWCGIPFHTEASASASIAKQKDVVDCRHRLKQFVDSRLSRRCPGVQKNFRWRVSPDRTYDKPF